MEWGYRYVLDSVYKYLFLMFFIVVWFKYKLGKFNYRCNKLFDSYNMFDRIFTLANFCILKSEIILLK